MENENSASEAKKILEKYDNYTFLEFCIKPAMFEEYIQALRVLNEFMLIDSLFENYLEILVKNYSKFQNPYQGFTLENCQKSKKVMKLMHLITIVKISIILIYFFFILKNAYECDINLKLFIDHIYSLDFFNFFFETLELYSKKRNSSIKTQFLHKI